MQAAKSPPTRRGGRLYGEGKARVSLSRRCAEGARECGGKDSVSVNMRVEKK